MGKGGKANRNTVNEPSGASRVGSMFMGCFEYSVLLHYGIGEFSAEHFTP